MRNPGGHNTKHLVCCSYDNLRVLGNGKLDKQAKLVSARNMIVKIRKVNIGIVNETLASGVTLDPCVDPKPHKKPLVRQFKTFTSGGTLGSSFVPASSSSSKLSTEVEVVIPPVCSTRDTDPVEIEQYKAYIEGKIETPAEKLPPKPSEDHSETGPASEPKIVFKRSAKKDTEVDGGDMSEPSNKKQRVEASRGGAGSSDEARGRGWGAGRYSGYGGGYYGYGGW